MKPLTTKEFIERSLLAHSTEKFDYSETKYITSRVKVKITCTNKHTFYQSPRSHMTGHGCPICSGRGKLTTEIFVTRATKVHRGLYHYSKVKYRGNKKKVNIICSRHGTFFQTPDAHINQKQGCPMCKKSHGELAVSTFLDKFAIEYVEQWREHSCSLVNGLVFDLYLPERNIIIEYDGRQHFEPVGAFGGEEEFIKIQERDFRKDNWCKINGYRLIRIPYYEDVEGFLRRCF